MKKAKLKHPFPPELARALAKRAGQGEQVTYLRKVIALSMVAEGIRARDIARRLFVSIQAVWSWTAEYNRTGPGFLTKEYRRGGPRRRKAPTPPTQ